MKKVSQATEYSSGRGEASNTEATNQKYFYLLHNNNKFGERYKVINELFMCWRLYFCLVIMKWSVSGMNDAFIILHFLYIETDWLVCTWLCVQVMIETTVEPLQTHHRLQCNHSSHHMYSLRLHSVSGHEMLSNGANAMRCSSMGFLWFFGFNGSMSIFTLCLLKFSDRWEQRVWKWHRRETKRWEHITFFSSVNYYLALMLAVWCAIIDSLMKSVCPSQFTASGWCQSSPCWGRQGGIGPWRGIWWSCRRGNSLSIS